MDLEKLYAIEKEIEDLIMEGKPVDYIVNTLSAKGYPKDFVKRRAKDFFALKKIGFFAY